MIKAYQKDKRSEAQKYDHYIIERELADRLRKASKLERQSLYTSLYEELFFRVPFHSQLIRKRTPELQQAIVAERMKLLRKLLGKNKTFLELGSGDCSLALEVAKHVKKVFAVDVSETITKSHKFPLNFQLLISNGCSIPVPVNSVDIVYSNQLMEHLHPDDAYDQLNNVYDILKPGGVYLCLTPNRLNGPHDISKYYDEVAKGFHIKEYTLSELSTLFKAVGFSSIKNYFKIKGMYSQIPLFLGLIFERLLLLIPDQLQKRNARTKIARAFISIRILGRKDCN